MNIFFLDSNPKICAEMHCDRHIVKMITESAQMLCTAHHFYGSPWQGIYKKTHVNHPCTLWARSNSENYEWLFQLFKAQSNEYTMRYGKVHLAWSKCYLHLQHTPKLIPVGKFTEPPKCMPNEFHCDTVIESYRTYYNLDKYRFATWKHRKVPFWFKPINKNIDIDIDKK